MKNLAVAKAKIKAHYTCEGCSGKEFIQTHHEIPGDDSTIVVLCGECHSRKHPDVPKALFLSVIRQSYWVNKSAVSLAKELGVHPRTIIRAAKRLEILPGDNLSQWDEELIRNNIPKLRQLKMECPSCDSGEVYYRRILKEFVCRRCGCNWKEGSNGKKGRKQWQKKRS